MRHDRPHAIAHRRAAIDRPNTSRLHRAAPMRSTPSFVSPALRAFGTSPEAGSRTRAPRAVCPSAAVPLAFFASSCAPIQFGAALYSKPLHAARFAESWPALGAARQNPRTGSVAGRNRRGPSSRPRRIAGRSRQRSELSDRIARTHRRIPRWMRSVPNPFAPNTPLHGVRALAMSHADRIERCAFSLPPLNDSWRRIALSFYGRHSRVVWESSDESSQCTSTPAVDRLS